MAKRLTYGEYLSPNYRPIMQQDAARFKAIMERNEKIANSPLEDRNGIDVDLDIVPTATPNTGSTGGTVTGTSVLGNESAAEAAKSLYVQPNLIKTMGYTEWLEAGGMTGMAQKQYDAAVRAAETDYAKSKALYGQNAETLGRAGLTGSGYGDYLTGAGFAAMQGAKVAAADTRALTEAQQRSDYANYLMTVDAQNREAQAVADAQNRQTYAEYLTREGGAKQAIEDMMLSGNDDAAIRAYIQQHYGNEFDAQLDSWITGAHAYTDPILAKQQEEQAKVENETTEADALERGQAARDALLAGYQNGTITNRDSADFELKRLGYTNEEINTAFESIGTAVMNQELTKMEMSSATLADIPTENYINDLVTTGQITNEQAEQLKTLAKQKRAKMLEVAYDNLANSKDPNADAAALYEEIDDFYKGNEISKETYQKLYALKAEAYINTAPNKKEPVTFLLARISEMRAAGADQVAVSAFEETISKTINVIDVVQSGTNATLEVSVGGAEGVKNVLEIGNVDVSNIKTNTQGIEYIHMKADPVSDKNLKNTTLGTGTDGQIKSFGGKIYTYKNNRWWELSVNASTQADTGSKQNSLILYSIVAGKYSGVSKSGNKTPQDFVYDPNYKPITPPTATK